MTERGKFRRANKHGKYDNTRTIDCRHRAKTGEKTCEGVHSSGCKAKKRGEVLFIQLNDVGRGEGNRAGLFLHIGRYQLLDEAKC